MKIENFFTLLQRKTTYSICFEFKNKYIDFSTKYGVSIEYKFGIYTNNISDKTDMDRIVRKY